MFTEGPHCFTADFLIQFEFCRGLIIRNLYNTMCNSLANANSIAKDYNNVRCYFQFRFFEICRYGGNKNLTLQSFCSQDNVRNQLIQFELLLTTATFVVAIFGVVAGIFGMNFTIPLFDNAGAFKWVLIITGVTGFCIFSAFVWFFKYRRLMPL